MNNLFINGVCQLEDVKWMVSNNCLIDTYSNIYNDKKWQQAHFEETCSCFELKVHFNENNAYNISYDHNTCPCT